MINKLANRLVQYTQDQSARLGGKTVPKSKAANSSAPAKTAKTSGASRGHTLSAEKPSQRVAGISTEARNRMKVSGEKYAEWREALNSRNVGDGFHHAMLLTSKEKLQEESKALSRVVEEKGPSPETEQKKIELECKREMIERELKRTEPAFLALEGIHDVKESYKEVKAEIKSIKKASDGKKLDAQAKRDIKELKDVSKKLKREINRLEKLVNIRKSLFSRVFVP